MLIRSPLFALVALAISGCSLFGEDGYVYPEVEVGQFAFEIEEPVRGTEGEMRLVRYVGAVELRPHPSVPELIDLRLQSEPEVPGGAAPSLRLSVLRTTWDSAEPVPDATVAAYYRTPQSSRGGGDLVVLQQAPVFRARFDVEVEREGLFGAITVRDQIRGTLAFQRD